MQILSEALDNLLTKLVQIGAPVAQFLQLGLPRAEIMAQLEYFSLNLPKEVYELYQWRNGMLPGQGVNHELFPGGYFPPLEDSLKFYYGAIKAAKKIAKEGNISPSVVWNKRWFPLFSSIDGDLYVISCGKKQREHAPIYFIQEEDYDGTEMVYDSLTIMVSTILQAYEQNIYYIDDSGALHENTERHRAIRRALNPKSVKWMAERAGGVHTAQELIMILKSKNGYMQGKVFKELITNKDETKTDLLIRTLSDENPVVRMMVARVLGELREVRAVSALITALSDEEEFVRSTAVQALCEIGNEDAIDPLITSLQRESESVRVPIITALGLFKASKAVDLLTKMLEDRSENVRSAVQKALRNIKNERGSNQL